MKNTITVDTDLQPIIKRALRETVTDIGQLTKEEERTLQHYVKRGWLSKGKGGPWPRLKTVYAFPGFDFAGARELAIQEMTRLAEWDRLAKEQRKPQ